MVLNSKSGREDPLASVTAPPPNESDHDRRERIGREAEAKRVSDRIDNEIQQEKAAYHRGDIIKVLLLGK